MHFQVFQDSGQLLDSLVEPRQKALQLRRVGGVAGAGIGAACNRPRKFRDAARALRHRDLSQEFEFFLGGPETYGPRFGTGYEFSHCFLIGGTRSRPFSHICRQGRKADCWGRKAWFLLDAQTDITFVLHRFFRNGSTVKLPVALLCLGSMLQMTWRSRFLYLGIAFVAVFFREWHLSAIWNSTRVLLFIPTVLSFNTLVLAQSAFCFSRTYEYTDSDCRPAFHVSGSAPQPS
jgi:hypothetical protein